MPKVKKCCSGGFAGLASLIGVTFLLIATVIGVSVVNNRGITLNPNKMAEVYPSPSGSGVFGYMLLWFICMLQSGIAKWHREAVPEAFVAEFH